MCTITKIPFNHFEKKSLTNPSECERAEDGSVWTTHSCAGGQAENPLHHYYFCESTNALLPVTFCQPSHPRCPHMHSMNAISALVRLHVRLCVCVCRSLYRHIVASAAASAAADPCASFAHLRAWVRLRSSASACLRCWLPARTRARASAVQ